MIAIDDGWPLVWNIFGLNESDILEDELARIPSKELNAGIEEGHNNLNDIIA